MAKRGIEDELSEGDGPQERLDVNQFFKSAIDNGLKALSERHLGYTPKTLAKYMDERKVQEYTAIISKEMKKYQAQGKDIREVAQKAYTGLASLAASGELFNEEGLNLIFRKSLRRKLGRKKEKGVLEGEKYLEDAMQGFRKLYDLTGSEEFSEQLPELSNAVRALYKIKALDEAISALYEGGKMNEEELVEIKRLTRRSGEKSVGQIKNVIGGYLDQMSNYTTAAVVFGLIGIGVIIASLTSNITGNVTGMTKVSVIPALTFGALSLVFGIYLWMNKKGKSQNRITLKN